MHLAKGLVLGAASDVLHHVLQPPPGTSDPGAPGAVTREHALRPFLCQWGPRRCGSPIASTGCVFPWAKSPLPDSKAQGSLGEDGGPSAFTKHPHFTVITRGSPVKS